MPGADSLAQEDRVGSQQRLGCGSRAPGSSLQGPYPDDWFLPVPQLLCAGNTPGAMQLLLALLCIFLIFLVTDLG